MERTWHDDGWRIPDTLWAKIEPLLPPPAKVHPWGVHNPRVPNRQALDGIFFVLRTGCQWNALNATGICSSSSAHRRFQEWVAAGFFQELWAMGLEEYDSLQGIDWEWQALDGTMHKAPLGGKKNRTQSHRSGQNGHQRERVGGRCGCPLGGRSGGSERQRLQAHGSHAGK